MTDHNDSPLTAEERAELEQLRAEKAKREEEARARRERAELERLRAEHAVARASQQDGDEPDAAFEPAGDAAAAAPAPAAERPRSAVSPVWRAARRPQEAASAVDPEKLTFGQKMVMTKDEVDEDGIPPMPPAQKLIIAAACVALVAAVWWLLQGRLG